MKHKVYYYALDKRDTTSFFRMVGVLPFIYHPDIDFHDISDTKIWDWTVVCGASAIILQRPFTRDHVAIIMGAKNMGLRVILDYDDLLSEVDQYNPTYQLYRDNQASLKLCYQYADEIWCSTAAIAESIGEKCIVIPNAHNDYLFPVSKKREFNMATKKAFYRGGSSHQADVNEKADLLIRSINKHTDWMFSIMGDRFTYIEQRTGENHHIIPGIPLMEYFRFLNQNNPNIMLFPLCDTKFNRAKSNISWLEATYSGAVLFGNKNLPEFHHAQDIDTLEATLDGYDPESLRKLNEQSWQYIQDNLLLSKINELRLERCLRLCEKQD